MSNNKITKKQYEEMLEKHDWYYEYSDDHSVWQAGSNNLKLIEEIADQSEEFTKMYNAKRQKMFNQM